MGVCLVELCDGNDFDVVLLCVNVVVEVGNI